MGDEAVGSVQPARVHGAEATGPLAELEDLAEPCGERRRLGGQVVEDGVWFGLRVPPGVRVLHLLVEKNLVEDAGCRRKNHRARAVLPGIASEGRSLPWMPLRSWAMAPCSPCR